MPAFPDQQPGETPKAYAAFCAYCALGSERSLEKTRQRLGKDSAGYTRVLDEWSGKHAWVERAAAYDRAVAAELASQVDTARRAEIERLRNEARNDAAQLRELGRAAASVLLERLENLAFTSIEPQQIGGLLNAINRTLATATDLDAARLGIDAVLEHLDDDEPDQTEPKPTANRVGG